jgi:hypothetical protein
MKKLASQGGRVACAALCFAAGSAHSLSPADVFQKVSPGVWAVRALDAEERPFRFGSAVVVAPGRLVTSCHVLARAKGVQVRREGRLYEASLEHADVQRDLCLLAVKGMDVSPVPTAKADELSIGQRVFAIGHPERLAVTLSEGLLSGLREEDGSPLLQTTAPTPPGFSGAGLFDESGRLVGILTLAHRGQSGGAQTLRFALPAEWVAQIPERAVSQMQARSRSAGTDSSPPRAIPGLPPVGTTWEYGFRDRQYSTRERIFTVRAESVSERAVRESFAGGSGEASTQEVDPLAMRFNPRRLTGDYAVIELAPYFFSTDRALTVDTRPANYSASVPWEVSLPRVQPEDVSVPAGTFKAFRVDVSGTIVGLGGTIQLTTYGAERPVRFHYTAWYAPQVNRYVMVRHQTWNVRGTQIGDEVAQLLKYKTN